MTTAAKVDSYRRPLLAALLAFVFPGLGHSYLGRRKTAALFAVVVSLCFLLGLSLEGRLYTVEQGQPLTILATFAVSGAGLLNLGARILSSNPGGTVLSPTYEYGCAFLLTAGLMNLLLMLDAWDIATGKKEVIAALLPTDHFVIMTVYALLVSAFFALLWREESRERWRLFGILLGSLVLGGLAVAWLMYPFPS